MQIEPNGSADGTTLDGVYAVLYLDIARSATEPELTDLYATTDLEPSQLSGLTPGCELSTEDGYPRSVEGEPSETSAIDLLIHDSTDLSFWGSYGIRNANAVRGLLDIWVYGRDLSETRIRQANVEEYRDDQVGVHGNLEAIVYWDSRASRSSNHIQAVTPFRCWSNRTVPQRSTGLCNTVSQYGQRRYRY